MTTETKLSLLENEVSAIWVKSGDALWVWSSDRSVESHDPADRCGGPYHISGVVDEELGYEDKWFLACVADSYFPAYYLVCARSFEQAYDLFVDNHSEYLAIDENDLKDYENEDGEYEGNYSSDGVPVDTESINISEVSLSRVDFK